MVSLEFKIRGIKYEKLIKYIISAADLHFKNLNGLSELGEVTDNFIEQCKQFVDSVGKDNVRIVIAGDIFDSKINITNEAQLAVNDFFRKLDDICITYVTAGNHDFLMNNTDRVDSLSPIFEIGSFENVKYMDKMLDYKSGVIYDDNIAFALWSSFDKFTTPDLTLVEGDKTIVGIIHAEISGSVSILNVVSTNGINPGEFKDCEFVIAGHIHKHQEIKENGVKIVYCSSLKQKDKGETINQHGYVLWSLDNGDWDYEFKEVDNAGYGYYNFVIKDIKDIEEDKEELINFV